jgi:hypothetical protein
MEIRSIHHTNIKHGILAAKISYSFPKSAIFLSPTQRVLDTRAIYQHFDDQYPMAPTHEFGSTDGTEQSAHSRRCFDYLVKGRTIEAMYDQR